MSGPIGVHVFSLNSQRRWTPAWNSDVLVAADVIAAGRAVNCWKLVVEMLALGNAATRITLTAMVVVAYPPW